MAALQEAAERRTSMLESEAPQTPQTKEQNPPASLRVIPLVGESADEPHYRLLGPDTTDLVDVSEVEGGAVPHLRIHNRLD